MARTMTSFPATLLLLAAAVLTLMTQDVAAHGMHGMHAEADASQTDYKCPVCRMSTMSQGYANANYIEMKNGQRVYTCGMDPRTFPGYDLKSTDTSYLAANIAQFIIGSNNKDKYKCTSTCDDCASGNVRDPISGAPVTADSFKIVCLENGQKIYFASDTTRTAYLSKVNQEVRSSVLNVMCKNAVCDDAQQIQTLSAAAKAFDPSSVQDVAIVGGGNSNASPSPAAGKQNSTSNANAPSSQTTAPSSDTATDAANTNTAVASSSGFCSGEGSVMFNGFSSTIHGSCVRLFFQPWVLNSALKYVLGFFGCLLLALANEYLVMFREHLRQQLLIARKGRPDDKVHRLSCKALLSFLYMVQMSVAYFAMLVVMTYETGLFIALILGFGAGFVLFKDFDVDVTNERGVWRFTDPSVVRIQVEGMSCMANCGTTVENALAGVDGVTKVHVEFSEKCAYVAGSAPLAKLVDMIEAVGFTAKVESHAFTPAQV